MTEVNKFQDWVLSKTPELTKSRSIKKVRKTIDRKVKELKKKIKDVFDIAIKFTPKEEEVAFKGYLKTYTVDGEKGIDPKVFLNRIKPKVLKLIRGKDKPIKLKFMFYVNLPRKTWYWSDRYEFG